MNINTQSPLASFFKLESASGILLIFATILAFIFANTPLAKFYELLLSTPLEIHIGELSIAKPLLLWINDGLMAMFFFLVGLELKRELLEGELSNRKNIVLPGIGAMIRIPSAAKLSAMSSSRFLILEILTPASGIIS